MELSYNEDMQHRAKLGCKVCLASNMWEFRQCPIRKSEKTGIASVAPLIADSDHCPVDGAHKAQATYSEVLLTLDTGVYPYKGGTLDQPQAFIDALVHVKGMKNAAEAERFDRSRKK